ncbi:hypothetical protein AAHE18_19G039900 [Arachis hypogaea]
MRISKLSILTIITKLKCLFLQAHSIIPYNLVFWKSNQKVLQTFEEFRCKTDIKIKLSMDSDLSILCNQDESTWYHTTLYSFDIKKPSR